jgi:hypothetical protein
LPYHNCTAGEVQTLKEAVKQKEDALNNALSTFMEVTICLEQ